MCYFQAHCHYYLVKVFIEALDRTEEPSIADVLKQLCQLFAAHGIIENTADFTMVRAPISYLTVTPVKVAHI